ncbi:NAD(P)-binding domain-containing protein, partial [Pseudomonas sp. ODNR1LW]|nr:NAD(P)-binding domain-containing protein [Pseudomonas sp. ODNR1LW]
AGAGALVEAGAEVRIVNRSRDRAEALAADLGPSVRVMTASEALDGAVLVINALSVQPDLDFDAVAPGTVMMDMTYKPLVTPFLAQARARGLPTVDGLAMLIGQAAPSFQALFRRLPPPLDLRALLTAHLGQAA